MKDTVGLQQEKTTELQIRDLLKLGQKLNYWAHGYDYPRQCRQVFGNLSLEGRNVLEIGCGRGLLSLWAAINKARSVVALEPLEDGSGSFEESKVYTEFLSIVDALGLKNVAMVPSRIQDYQRQEQRFDIVLSVASVNHLDEMSCMHLHEGDAARARYVEIFRGIASAVNVGGKLVLIDCSRRNFFPDVGLTNPMAKSIEWFKHQRPDVWVELLTKCGFSNPQVSWLSGRYLRYLGISARRGWMAYFLDSMFRVEMTYTDS